MTLSISAVPSHYAECYCDGCHILFIMMLSLTMRSVIMLNVIKLNVIVLNVIMLDVIMLNVVILSFVNRHSGSCLIKVRPCFA